MTSKIVLAMVVDYPIEGMALNGGVQAVATYLVEEIKKCSDIKLHIITFKCGVEQTRRIEADGISIHIIPAQKFGALSRYRYDLVNFRECLSKIAPDVIHAQGAGIGGYLSLKTKYPSIVTIHGLIGEDAKYKSKFFDRLRLKLQSLITEMHCIKYAENVILISSFVGRYYGANLAGKKHYIPNPVKAEFFELPRRERGSRVLFIGKLIPIKGVLDLIQAVALASKESDIELVLAGSTDDKKYLARIKELITETNMQERVHIAGLLTEAQLMDEMSVCAVVALPSYHENAPMAIQQAMAAGIAIVASSVGGIPDQLSQGDAGLLYEPGDIPALASQLLNLLKNEKYRHELGRRAKKKATKEFRPEYVVKKTVELYKNVLL